MKYVVSALALIVAANLGGGGALAAEADADAGVTDVSGVVVIAPTDDGYRTERSSAGTRTDTPLQDVPQAISIVTDDLIRDQSMRGMADVLRFVPGASMGQGEGHRDAPTLRGNASTADFFVDGVRDDVQYLRDLYNVERVEVLKGPNAMIFGRGGGGGIINRVTKRANWTDAREASLELGSFDHRRATVDLSTSPMGAAWSARIVSVLEDSGSFRDHVGVERWGVNPSIGWRSDAGLTAVLSYEHFEDERTVDRGIPSAQGRPSPARRSAFFGDPEQSFSTLEADSGALAVEYQLGPDVLLRNRTVIGVYDKFYQNIYPGSAVTAAGTFNLGAYSTGTQRENLFNQADLVWTTGFAGMRHTLLAGVELGRQETDNRRLTGYFGGTATSLTRPFGSPTAPNTPVTFRASATDADNHVVAKVAAVFLQDQLEVTEQLQLLLGLRFDSFDLDFRNNRNGQRLSRRDELWSPRVGLVYKPVEPLSLYASYSVSYLPSSGDQFSSLSDVTVGLEPEAFRNYEVGAKWQVTPEIAATLAAYRLDRDNTTAPDPANPSRLVQTGAQRSKGVEASVAGQLADRWDMIANFAWQEATIRRRTAAAAAGQKVPLVPERSASIWSKFEINPTFSVGLGVLHQSRVFAAIDNSVVLPGFTRVDAAVFVNLTDTLRAQVNVENIADETYYPTSHGNNNILPGSPRAVRVSLQARF